MHQSASDHLDPKTGASAGLTPFRSDFFDYVECEIDVRNITKVNKVVGIGTTLHKFVDSNGNHVHLPCVSYHLPMTDVRLFSPQIYHQLHGGHSVVNGDEMVMKFLKEGALISIPIDRNATNLPVVHNSFASEKVRREHASKFLPALHATELYAALDYFANVSVDKNLSTSSRKQDPASSFPCVGGLKNENLSMPQKKLLLWHWKLGIGRQCLQAMIQNRIFEDPFGRLQCHPPIIKTKFTSTSSCSIPKCQSCELAQARQRSPKIKQVQLNLDSEGASSCAIPKCQSCESAWAQQRSPKIEQVQSNFDSEGAISCAIPKCQSCELARA
jgi:hypothetical protein